ncbi:hypothetical protein DEIPH_ctg032orf0055 [Deinococcus phoenicis]|uniref:Type I restriction modification DNA specificity domain-containing protein n=2 Tax=Deinococcus phoenicis TaxID=1476583 RepID=A0A016QP82_9DEIO|nr:hypothetical protein DEIPH_ctg032orf0055 [Deinococcus phoenicis]
MLTRERINGSARSNRPSHSPPAPACAPAPPPLPCQEMTAPREEQEGLPEGWAKVELGQLGIWGSGGTPPRTNPAFYAESGIPWLVIGDLNDGLVFGAKNHITESGLKNSAAKLLDPGTLLVAMYGSIGKMGITGMQCATNQAIAFCIPSEGLTHLKFLFYALKNEQQALVAQGQGGAQQNISQTILKAHPVPLPPLPEQKRIADKLDALLSRVEAGRERLERVPKLVKQFRQAVLSAAVSGELTREWRGGGDAAWEETTIGELLTGIEAGLNVKCEERPPLEAERGLVKISAVTWGRFQQEESKTLPPTEEVPETRRVKRGDFLISRANTLELVGACVIVERITKKLYLSDKVLRLNFKNDGNKVWALYCLRSGLGRQQIESLVSGNQLSMRNLSQDALRSIVLPLPPLPEQVEIVRRVEALFAIADRLEQRYQSALVSFQRLTPALLGKAFRGELVPQNPADEPASVLLARVRAQRAAEGTGPKRGRKPGKAAGQDGAEPKRRGRPPKAQAIPTAMNEAEALRLLQERRQQRAEGARLVGLFED